MSHYAKVKEWRKANPDKVAAQARRFDPDGARERYERWRANKEALLTRAAGRPRPDACELCGEKGKTVFDHCHARGHFRGWLCDRCNRTLGQVKDDAALLRAMAAYLEANDGSALDEGAQVAA